MADSASTSPAADPQAASASSSSGNLFTIPYRPPEPGTWDAGAAERLTRILDFLVAHPSWMAVPMGEPERRLAYGMVLTDPRNRIREVWNGGNLVGLLYLGEIQPLVSATVHFIFLDEVLIGKRRLLWKWFGECMTEWDLQRLTMLVPENVPVLERYARKKLHFKYEGEDRLVGHPTLDYLKGVDHASSHVWVAKQGSRRERSHWSEGAWHDVIVLRLLRSEYEAQEPPM
jgi:hypothetical protein